MYEALEVAQAACDRTPRNAEAWALLARIVRHVGLPAASDQAFQKAAALDRHRWLPYRGPPLRFRALVDEVRRELPPSLQRRLEGTAIQVRPLPALAAVRAGVHPDTLAVRPVPGQLVLFQLNHENNSAGEDDLRSLIARSLAEG
jgi:hypothetical protein